MYFPDENLVFCPEKTLTAVIAHIHYFPDAWKGQAHTTKVWQSHFPESVAYESFNVFFKI